MLTGLRRKDIFADMPALERIEDGQLNKCGLIIPDGSVSKQLYSPSPRPHGVEVVKASVSPIADGQGGYFMELVRFQRGLVMSLMEKDIFLDVSNGQVNLSVVGPGTERYGHLHPDQDELWMVGEGQLHLGVYDIRQESETSGLTARFVLSPGNGVFVPHGVVHSLANHTREKVVLVYLATHKFSSGKDTQEWRYIPDDPNFWDFLNPEKI